MKLSIIIPVYNEEKTIKEVISNVRAVKLSKYGIKKEVIVVDDGSEDNTLEILKKINSIKLVQHIKNQGKGAAIKTGLNYVTGDVVIIQDADLEYEPDNYSILVKPILEGETDVVYGSRMLTELQRHKIYQFFKGKRKVVSIFFYIGGKMLTLLANVLYNIKITDEATCYKVFKTSVIKSLNLECTRFEFCPEVTAKVAKRGIKIIEIPIDYTPRSTEEGKKIKFRDGFKAIWTLVKYRLID